MGETLGVKKKSIVPPEGLSTALKLKTPRERIFKEAIKCRSHLTRGDANSCKGITMVSNSHFAFGTDAIRL